MLGIGGGGQEPSGCWVLRSSRLSGCRILMGRSLVGVGYWGAGA